MSLRETAEDFSMAQYRYYPNIWLEGLKETTKDFNMT
jgi:hypothetical protein